MTMCALGVVYWILIKLTRNTRPTLHQPLLMDTTQYVRLQSCERPTKKYSSNNKWAQAGQPIVAFKTHMAKFLFSLHVFSCPFLSLSLSLSVCPPLFIVSLPEFRRLKERLGTALAVNLYVQPTTAFRDRNREKVDTRSNDSAQKARHLFLFQILCTNPNVKTLWQNIGREVKGQWSWTLKCHQNASLGRKTKFTYYSYQWNLQSLCTHPNHMAFLAFCSGFFCQ